jgi:hypothetical protein
MVGSRYGELVDRAIVGYHLDEEGDWVAHLDCGHRQHVRHRPPFQVRPWVVDEEGRRSRLGALLECPLCDRGELVRDPPRVLLAGDWHGNGAWADECIRLAAEHGCPTVLQLGDFGLWPGREEAWLDHLDASAAGAGVNVVWIDGNHENHDWLEKARAESRGPGLLTLRDRVTWAGRGVRWEWSGFRFGALGGAVSIDRFLRRPGVNWWPQEAPTEDDVRTLGDEPLDILVTHAAPASVPFPPLPVPLPEAILADARRARELIDRAVAATRPRLVVHGHHHVRYGADGPGYRVEGLAHDKAGSPDAWAILHLQGAPVVA